MGPTSAIVLFAVVWFMVFFVVLPLRLQTQGEAGEIVPGTHSSAPANIDIRRKAKVTTIFAVVIWAVLTAIILSGWFSIHDFDWFNRMTPVDAEANG